MADGKSQILPKRCSFLAILRTLRTFTEVEVNKLFSFENQKKASEGSLYFVASSLQLKDSDRYKAIHLTVKALYIKSYFTFKCL